MKDNSILSDSDMKYSPQLLTGDEMKKYLNDTNKLPLPTPENTRNQSMMNFNTTLPSETPMKEKLDYLYSQSQNTTQKDKLSASESKNSKKKKIYYNSSYKTPSNSHQYNNPNSSSKSYSAYS